MNKLRIGIVGYGNIGRGVEKAVNSAPDMELIGVFTRRDPAALETLSGAPVYGVETAASMRDKIDVMMLCGGSATDLAVQGPEFAAMFNTVDSFDTHAKIPEYLAALDSAAKNTTAVISAGWDPGLFSMLRMLSGAVLPNGRDYTFWGYGVSQGHSVAIRRIRGVKNAVQYTVPIEKAVEAVRSGSSPELTTGERHVRECYVVAEEGADRRAIEREIKTMPDYFADNETIVTFISEDKFKSEHAEMPHGGTVFRSGSTGGKKHVIEFSLKLESNPEFTGSVLTAYARAAARLSREGQYGAKTVLDIP
ncbi:MAG: diaminopimelate dehydrogenase, partial [Clostridiales bacterium]|nr:diaminopimelate dehydrogenase [Clostridiales bacterium]